MIMGNDTSNNRRHKSDDDGECRPNIRCLKCGEIGHTSRKCDLVIVSNIKGCRKLFEIHDDEYRSNIRCFKCDGIGHVSRECDLIIVPNVKECNHCGGKHASSSCRHILRQNLEEEQRKLELEKKVEKLEGQVDKMLKLSEEDEKKGGASANNPRNNSETKNPRDNNPETKNNPFYKNSAPQLEPHNMNPVNFEGTPLQFIRLPPPMQTPVCSQPPPPMQTPVCSQPPPPMQTPVCSQLQNNPPFNQSPNQPFPNLFPNNFTTPAVNPLTFPNIQQLHPNVQQTFQQPHSKIQPTPGYNQQRQQSFPNNQNVRPEFNNSDLPHTSHQTTQFKKPFQNQANNFNQKQNTLEDNNISQQRRENNGGRGGFNRGRGGNRAGWKNHYVNSNWRKNCNENREFNNKGRGGSHRGNYNKDLPQLFTGGKSNHTKSDKAEGNVPDSEQNQTERKGRDANDFRKGRDANDFRPNRNHQGVFRGGIHKERVNIKGRDTHKVQEPNKKDNNSNCDSDSTGTSLETAPNAAEHKKKRRANRRKKERTESSNDSAENTSDKKPEEVTKEDENQPLSKNNLGEGDILMKYIGTKLPKITDAITDNVSLYQKVQGVMLMSDPSSDEPVLEPAKNLLHIIEFKGLHPKAKSFFC